MLKAPGSHGHHLRFYIVLVTLTVGALLFLMLLNNNTGDNDFSLTGALMGLQGDGEEVAEEDEREVKDKEDKIIKKSRDVSVKLSFDQIPTLKKKTKISELELRFDDLETLFKVNDNRLEWNNMKEVTLRIKDYEGELSLDNYGFSLDGKAKRIEVNDLAFSSDKGIEIVFDDLSYFYSDILDFEVDNIRLPRGYGTLEAADKLQYDLEDEGVDLYNYKGSLNIDKQGNSTLTLEGDVSSIGVEGDYIDFNVN